MGNEHVYAVARRQEAEKSWGATASRPAAVSGPELGYGSELSANYRVNLLFRKSNQMQVETKIWSTNRSLGLVQNWLSF